MAVAVTVILEKDDVGDDDDDDVGDDDDKF